MEIEFNFDLQPCWQRKNKEKAGCYDPAFLLVYKQVEQGDIHFVHLPKRKTFSIKVGKGWGI